MMMLMLRRVGMTAKLLLLDLARRRITLLLMFIVPALFDLVVFATTGKRNVDVTVASLMEDGAILRVTGEAEDPLDPGLLDNGFRTLDQRGLSLVFLGTAAVCFLACFLAFNLVHKRREADARLVLMGLRPRELLIAKLLVLFVLALTLSVYETAILRPFLAPKHVLRVATGFLIGGMVYGSFGLLIGSVALHELEGIFTIVLLTNIDVGWLQNPIYYSTSERRGLIESLPGHFPTQLAVSGAFADEPMARGHAWHAAMYALAALCLALGVLTLRRRRAAWR